jgi:7,8-dihydroneopterin aldolase/epimerase/oxygenase
MCKGSLKVYKFNSLKFSMSEFIIELKQLYFFSFHGLYEEEQKVGGEFSVDLIVKYIGGNNDITAIGETINYATLYEIVKKEMNQPRDLLETIAQSIAERIHKAFPIVKEMEICIEKKHPPIIGFAGSVGVRYKKQF